MFPRWSGLAHFPSGIMSVSFTDGSKCEDFSKVQFILTLIQMQAEYSLYIYRFLSLFFTIHLKKKHQAISY